VQIDYYEFYSKHAKLKNQRAILGFLNISGISKATNYPKVVNGDDGNLRAELPSWTRAELIVGGGWGTGSGGFAPETKQLYTCQSVFSFACNLVHERSEDAKNQSVCYISPHPPLCQLEASCGNLVSSWL